MEWFADKPIDASIFNWICIHELRVQLYKELAFYLEGIEDNKELLADLILFQKNMMLDTSYCPEQGRSVSLKYDWLSFFEYNHLQEVPKEAVTIQFKTRHVGRVQAPIIKGAPETLYNFAGGFRQVLDKSNSFTHNSWSRIK